MPQCPKCGAAVSMLDYIARNDHRHTAGDKRDDGRSYIVCAGCATPLTVRGRSLHLYAQILLVLLWPLTGLPLLAYPAAAIVLLGAYIARPRLTPREWAFLNRP